MKRQQLAAAVDVGEGQTIKFQFRRDGREVDGFLARFRGRLVAYENVCRHLPLTLDGDGGQLFSRDGRHFICHQHQATYEPLTGLCVRGPCEGEYLQALPIQVINGGIWLMEG